MNNFFGEFNKNAGYCGWQSNDEFEHIGSMEGFNECIYKKISSEIENLLGVKKIYTIFEVVYYFKCKYLAYRIPCQYFCCYKDTSIEYLDLYERQHYMEVMNPSFDPKERNITLVIDTIFNLLLRKRYPNIVRSDEMNKLRMKEEEHYGCRHENPIFILGTKDGVHLNSVYLLSGDCEIEDLNHEFYFFFNHS